MKNKLDAKTHGIRPKLHSQEKFLALNSFLKSKKQNTLSPTGAETPKDISGSRTAGETSAGWFRL